MIVEIIENWLRVHCEVKKITNGKNELIRAVLSPFDSQGDINLLFPAENNYCILALVKLNKTLIKRWLKCKKGLVIAYNGFLRPRHFNFLVLP